MIDRQPGSVPGARLDDAVALGERDGERLFAEDKAGPGFGSLADIIGMGGRRGADHHALGPAGEQAAGVAKKLVCRQSAFLAGLLQSVRVGVGDTREPQAQFLHDLHMAPTHATGADHGCVHGPLLGVYPIIDFSSA